MAPSMTTIWFLFSMYLTGETGCRMTFEALGPVASFECVQSDDFPILEGKVEFESIESAQKAVDTYNGMDMGLETKLVLTAT
jgi:hypothetical protein